MSRELPMSLQPTGPVLPPEHAGHRRAMTVGRKLPQCSGASRLTLGSASLAVMMRIGRSARR